MKQIQEELENVDFDINKLKVLLSGGEEAARKAKEMESAIKEEKNEKDPQFHRLSEKEKFRARFKQANAFISRVLPKLKREGKGQELHSREGLYGFFQSISSWMFQTSLRHLGTEEQKREWIPKIKRYEVIGSYAQTEMAHGSDVQGLKTTATFDKARDEFVIHTPSVQAAKFWPGGLGKTATHALVVAKLLIDGKYLGQHMFIVPLRNPEDYSLLPGVECGIVGPKHGLHQKDNGFAVFTNVRVPRNNMLMKYQQVDRRGKFSKQGPSKMFFLTLMEGRLNAAQFASDLLFKVLGFAFRYGTYRTQFKSTLTGLERKVADYQLFQYRLIPYLADAFAYFFLHKKQTREFQQFQSQEITEQILSGMHAQLSAVKSITTWRVAQGARECRERCGGHGYLKSAGFSDIEGIADAAVSVEGVNPVMALAASRFIVRNLKLAYLGKEVHPDIEYVKHIQIFHKIRAEIHSAEDVTLDKIKQVLTARLCFSIASYISEVVQLQRRGKAETQIQQDDVQSEMIQIARHHFDLFTFRAFTEEIKRGVSHNEIERRLQVHLERLALISGITMLKDKIELLYIGGYFVKNQKQIMEQVLKEEVGRVRPVVVGLLEASERGDIHLTSSIGSTDKDPCSELMREARASDRRETKKLITGLRKPKL